MIITASEVRTEVIGIYEVYIDVYFIENALMDAQALALVLLLLREKIVPWRLLAAALAGGLGAVLILLAGVGYGALYVFCVLALDCVMLFAAIPSKKGHRVDLRTLAMGIIYFHATVFAYGKLTECASRLGMGDRARVIVSVLVTAIVLFMVVYRGYRERRRLYDVVLVQNGANMELKALFDTGNLLTDPISGKPVSVLEETDVFRKWIAESPQKYKVIPYHSIGSEHGVMDGMYVDELIIRKDNERLVQRDAVVALYKGRLSKDGSFQMILNQSLL